MKKTQKACESNVFRCLSCWLQTWELGAPCRQVPDVTFLDAGLALLVILLPAQPSRTTYTGFTCRTLGMLPGRRCTGRHIMHKSLVHPCVRSTQCIYIRPRIGVGQNLVDAGARTSHTHSRHLTGRYFLQPHLVGVCQLLKLGVCLN